MNIYLHTEISVREIDSKILLAVLAASKGHQVIISDIQGIFSAAKKNIIPPGIFHTKSLTPTKSKIAKHQFLKDKGFLITSIDEEAGLDIDGYEQFSKTRYSDRTMEQSSMVFTWGTDDFECLKKNYPKCASKIFKTGSPRVDLWVPSFSTYWKNNNINIPKKPFLLVPCNFDFSNGNSSFLEIFKTHENAGYYEREPWLKEYHFGYASENFKTTEAFIKAITFISKNNNDYDIVVRPHPAENIEAWKTYLKDVPNVYVIRKDSISFWVDKCFAVMHNGCTTALEATVSQKPLISYVPYTQKYGNEIPNQLGHLAKTKEELQSKLYTIFNNYKSGIKYIHDEKSLRILNNKIFIDPNEIASHKIVEKWESKSNHFPVQKIKLFLLILNLRLINFKQRISLILKRLFPDIFGNYVKNYKFEPFDKKNIETRVNKILKILDRQDTKIDIKVIVSKTILIKKS